MIRKSSKEDYAILKTWFDHYDWKCDAEMIPEHSFISFENDIPVCFSCMYLTGTPIGVMGFTISNPNFDKTKRHAIVKNTIDFNIAEDNARIINRFVEEHDFKIIDNGNAYTCLKYIDNNINIDFLVD
jgi:hypothetical protein